MNTVNTELVRIILRTLIEYSRGYPGHLHDQTAQLLSGITPIEIENILEPCKQHFRIDIPSIGREIIRHRNDQLLRELVRAGATKALLRQIFGISPRQFTRLRDSVGNPEPCRRRLREEEIHQVRERSGSIPDGEGSPLALVVHCLDLSRELGLPFMPVYRANTDSSFQAHDQE